MNNHIVITAGGIGSRLWPMSTPKCPKQFIDILGCGKILPQSTAGRFSNLCPRGNMWVVTSERYKDIVQEQLSGIPENNMLAEPCPRNTAPCTAYTCRKIKKEYPGVSIVVTPPDQVVIDTTEFRRIIDEALSSADKDSAIITLGIKPGCPETGYGYIAAGESIARDKEIFHVESFREKPNRKTAKKYLAAGNYLWNAGIFVWNVRIITAIMRVYIPGITQIFDQTYPDFYTGREGETVKRLFPTAESILIDYAVMEKAEKTYVLPAKFGQSDSGAWGALQSPLPKDKEDNTMVGTDVRMYESRNRMVRTSQEERVIIQGLNDYIVTEKDNILLICQLSEEQRIKDFLKE